MGRKPMGHAEDTLTSSIAQLVSHASTLTTLSGFARSAQRTVNADSSSRETAEPEKLAHATTRQSMLLPTRCSRTESIEKREKMLKYRSNKLSYTKPMAFPNKIVIANKK